MWRGSRRRFQRADPGGPVHSNTNGPFDQIVVVVVGRPASGKSIISELIAERLGFPIVAKDELKEVLFEALGAGDQAWSESLGRASFALLDYVINLQLRTGASFIIDAAYNAAFENAKFQAWQKVYGFKAIQVHCTASDHELVRRFTKRQQDGLRHPGHADDQRVDSFRASLTDGRAEVLDLRGPVISCDIQVVGAVDVVLGQLEQIVKGRGGASWSWASSYLRTLASLTHPDVR
jgi:predicted kinase